MNKTEIKDIMSDLIDDPVAPMRTDLNRDALYELAQSIKQHGLINPITVRPVNERYEVVAGHRRFASCKIAGVIRIPCVVRDLDDSATFGVRAAENLFREDVDLVDEALFLAEYIHKNKLTDAEVATQINRSVQYVKDRLALLSMPDYMIEHLKTGKIKLGHALALMEIDNETTRHMWVELAVRDGANVKQVEFWVTKYKIDRIAMINTDDPNAVAGEPPAIGMPQQICPKCGIKDDADKMRLVWVHIADCQNNNA